MTKRKLMFPRPCCNCGTYFQPRKWQISVGCGRFCSKKCRLAVSKDWLNTAEAKKNSYESSKRNGFLAAKKMHAHPNSRLMYESIRVPKEEQTKRAVAYNRAYRARNKDRVNSWNLRRSGKKHGRLPNGWIGALLEKQRSKCVICRVNLGGGYHIDHITPLSAGGKHEKHNVQLLCPTCNVRKWAKNPIDYMQENGFLL